MSTLTIQMPELWTRLVVGVRTRLGLAEGRIAAAAAVHTFGDYLVFHPHLHLFAADGLFDEEGRFHSMPDESLAPVTELFRHRFLQALRDANTEIVISKPAVSRLQPATAGWRPEA